MESPVAEYPFLRHCVQASKKRDAFGVDYTTVLMRRPIEELVFIGLVQSPVQNAV